MTRALRTIVAVTALTLTAAAANAAIVDQGSTTLDTATGYEWLDVTQTRDCSYAVLSADTGSCNSVDLSQWTLASLAEVYEFWGNAGIGIQNSQVYTATYYTETLALINLVDPTLVYSDTFRGVNGVVSDDVAWAQLATDGDLGSRDLYYSSDYVGVSDIRLGGWFYRAQSTSEPEPGGPTVPEPGTLALLGLSLVGLVAARRRKH